MNSQLHAKVNLPTEEHLQKRYLLSFLSKVQSPRERMNIQPGAEMVCCLRTIPETERKAALQQRHQDPCVLPTNMEVPEVTLRPPKVLPH
ncbi:zinc finger protein 318-like protein [Lates japonicus]|uniref:Zinc finger protein 318-like protein n=1 Tax=Lates japonicus TaxID=270547 RepID=A0AAD3RAI7_LATJO|nr:zinc finger protein 318-like protein [Lates japonicus]